MTVELVFESRLVYQMLRQDGAVEMEPVITLQLEMTDGPQIYASDGSIINDAAWSMSICRHVPPTQTVTHTPGWVNYAAVADKARCVIDIHQSPDRYGALLEMLKGGRASEITVIIDALVETADYSKKWDTAGRASIPIKSICFEFPLPQSEA